MSIRLIASVWGDDYYKAEDKTKLLVALAIADSARDDGKAWPGIESLAGKARCSTRRAQEVIREMERDGKLVVEPRTGPNFTNTYIVRTPQPSHRQPRNGCTTTPATVAPLKPSHPATERTETLQPDVSDPCNGASARCTQTVENRVEPKHNRGLCAHFVRFWDVYPRKVGKDRAVRMWKKKKCAEHIDAIVAAIGWQRDLEQWKKDDGEFIPHPATWLNDGRWNDERPQINGSELGYGQHGEIRWKP